MNLSSTRGQRPVVAYETLAAVVKGVQGNSHPWKYLVHFRTFLPKKEGIAIVDARLRPES